MDNFLSYCGLADARISTSEKDLPGTYDEKRNKLTSKVDLIENHDVMDFFRSKTSQNDAKFGISEDLSGFESK